MRNTSASYKDTWYRNLAYDALGQVVQPLQQHLCAWTIEACTGKRVLTQDGHIEIPSAHGRNFDFERVEQVHARCAFCCCNGAILRPEKDARSAATDRLRKPIADAVKPGNLQGARAYLCRVSWHARAP